MYRNVHIFAVVLIGSYSPTPPPPSLVSQPAHAATIPTFPLSFSLSSLCVEVSLSPCGGWKESNIRQQKQRYILLLYFFNDSNSAEYSANVVFDHIFLCHKLFTEAHGVTNRCCLSWLTYSALVYQPKCGGVSFFQQMSTTVHKWSPNM